MPIRHLQRKEIDIAKWDACITGAANGLIYAHTFYLDEMTGGRWDGLVLGDYEAVMPLTWRRKYGIDYLYQPAFTQQTGVFSRLPLSAADTSAFLNAIPGRFRFAEINLNYGNPHPSLVPRTNYILSLNNPYETIAARYRADLRRNLRLAAGASLHYETNADPSLALRSFRQQYARRLPNTSNDDYNNFERLCQRLLRNEQLIVRAVYDSRQQLMATAILPRDERRLYLLQSTTLPAGRTVKANHFLLDNLIREWAGTPLTLDFEGSDIPGIALFYDAFGGISQPYYFYRNNRLPFPLNFLKPR